MDKIFLIKKMASTTLLLSVASVYAGGSTTSNCHSGWLLHRFGCAPYSLEGGISWDALILRSNWNDSATGLTTTVGIGKRINSNHVNKLALVLGANQFKNDDPSENNTAWRAGIAYSSRYYVNNYNQYDSLYNAWGIGVEYGKNNIKDSSTKISVKDWTVGVSLYTGIERCGGFGYSAPSCRQRGGSFGDYYVKLTGNYGQRKRSNSKNAKGYGIGIAIGTNFGYYMS